MDEPARYIVQEFTYCLNKDAVEIKYIGKKYVAGTFGRVPNLTYIGIYRVYQGVGRY